MLHLIEIAEGRTAGLWEPIIVLLILMFTTVAPRRAFSGAPIRYGLIRFLLLVYFPVYMVSLSLDSWGNLGTTLHFFARLAMAIAYIRLTLFLFLDVMLPRARSQATSRIVSDIVHGIVYIVGVLWLLRGAGLDALSLLTTGTVLGAVIGLSLQETLGNIFAGLAVQTEEPFSVGDWISLEGMSLVGQVLEVNWRATLIKTEDEEQINIPNAVIARTPIRNFNAPDPAFEVELPFSVPYHISPTQVKEIAERAATQVGWCDPRRPVCMVVAFDDSGVRYRLRFYSHQMAQRREQVSEVFENLWSGLAERGIPVGIPAREVRTFEIRPPGDEPDASLAPRLHALARLDVFTPLSLEDRRRLASRLEHARFPAGEIVSRQGDVEPSCTLIVSGHLEAVAAQGDGAPAEDGAPPAEPPSRRLGPGDFFGELTLLTGAPHPATVRAVTDVEAFVLRQAMLTDLLGHSQPAVLAAIGHALAQRCEAGGQPGPLGDAPRPPSPGQVEGQILDRMKRLFRLG